MKSTIRSTTVECALVAVLALLAGVLAGCATAPEEARYRPSQRSTPLPDGSFAAYLRAVDDHLARARVLHDPDDPAWEPWCSVSPFGPRARAFRLLTDIR